MTSLLEVDAWMRLAIAQANQASEEKEVPVGAVVLRGGDLVAVGYNRMEQLSDPSAHAEILALREASCFAGDWRLDGTTLVVTLEPCLMCLGAIIMARVERLIYGARDPRYGACGSAIELPDPSLAPHLREVRHATHPDECGDLLRTFFRELRASTKEATGPRSPLPRPAQ